MSSKCSISSRKNKLEDLMGIYILNIKILDITTLTGANSSDVAIHLEIKREILDEPYPY